MKFEFMWLVLALVSWIKKTQEIKLLTPVKTRVKMPELNAEERPRISLNKKGLIEPPFVF